MAWHITSTLWTTHPPFLSTCLDYYLYSNIIPSLIHCSFLALYSSESICHLSMIFKSRYSRISMKDQTRMVWERECFPELIPVGDLSADTCDSSSAFKLLWDQDALKTILTTPWEHNHLHHKGDTWLIRRAQPSAFSYSLQSVLSRLGRKPSVPPLGRWQARVPAMCEQRAPSWPHRPGLGLGSVCTASQSPGWVHGHVSLDSLSATGIFLAGMMCAILKTGFQVLFLMLCCQEGRENLSWGCWGLPPTAVGAIPTGTHFLRSHFKMHYPHLKLASYSLVSSAKPDVILFPLSYREVFGNTKDNFCSLGFKAFSQKSNSCGPFCPQLWIVHFPALPCVPWHPPRKKERLFFFS